MNARLTEKSMTVADRPASAGVPALAGAAFVRPIRLALKSGNFGAADFYDKALSVLGKV